MQHLIKCLSYAHSDHPFLTVHKSPPALHDRTVVEIAAAEGEHFNIRRYTPLHCQAYDKPGFHTPFHDQTLYPSPARHLAPPLTITSRSIAPFRCPTRLHPLTPRKSISDTPSLCPLTTRGPHIYRIFMDSVLGTRWHHAQQAPSAVGQYTAIIHAHFLQSEHATVALSMIMMQGVLSEF